ncbi:kinase-like domain-containing protein [Choanephora cucurbitarum]|nr:kinase-like domain-containing protein [Choanephora cucurbitarum]
MTHWFIPASLRLRRKEPRDPLIAGRYRCLGVLGQGAYGIVHLAVDNKTHQRFAMKEISKSRLERQQQSDRRYQPRLASNEQKKRRLNPTTVLQDPDYSLDSIFLELELAEKGVVMTLSEPTFYFVQQCRSIFRQLVYVVDHLHQQGIVHGDIKPHNLLLSKDNRVKLVDFGHAIYLCDIYSMSSPAFTAPEVIKK